MDAVVSIIMSVAALEAFINEASELADQHLALGEAQGPTSVSEFASVSKLVEDHQGQVQLKYLLASKLLAGRMIDKGSSTYQNFDMLIRLRNELIHYKPADRFVFSEETGHRVEHPNIVKKLRSKGITGIQSDPVDGVSMAASWVYIITTKAAARWACNTAGDIVWHILNSIPENKEPPPHMMGFKEKMESFYRRAFTHVT